MSSGLFRTVATAAVAVIAAVAAAGSASADVVYDNIPGPLPGNLPSLGFEATSTSEFGGVVQLAGSTHNNPTISVTLSSWGCETGSGATCATTEGSTFEEPITLKVYDVNDDGSPGALIAAQRQTFDIPYRPSADPGNCGVDSSAWHDAATDRCVNGKAVVVNFQPLGVTLPDRVLVSLGYDTTHYGYAPKGEATDCYPGCGYDSLNVALADAVTVGSLPRAADAYLNSTYAGSFCEGGLGVGTFRLDGGCWEGYQPAIEVRTPTAAGGGPAGSAPGQQVTTQPARGNQQASTNAAAPTVPGRKVVCASVPTLKRHTYRGAKKLLARSGCDVVLYHKGHAKHGKSHVKSQSTAPGTVLHEGDVLSVKLG